MTSSSYHAAIIDLRKAKSSVMKFDYLWSQVYDSLHITGSLWILASNTYFDSSLHPIPLEIANRISSVTRFKLKNIFIIYRQEEGGKKKIFVPAYFNLLFFVKSLSNYYFDKDSVRERHIFKDIEWGRRQLGYSGYNKRISVRYSDKGRDPGNVFYKTERNPQGQILNIYGYADKEIYEKILLMSTKEDNKIMSNINDSIFSDIVENTGRKLIMVEI